MLSSISYRSHDKTARCWPGFFHLQGGTRSTPTAPLPRPYTNPRLSPKPGQIPAQRQAANCRVQVGALAKTCQNERSPDCRLLAMGASMRTGTMIKDIRSAHPVSSISSAVWHLRNLEILGQAMANVNQALKSLRNNSTKRCARKQYEASALGPLGAQRWASC